MPTAALKLLLCKIIKKKIHQKDKNIIRVLGSHLLQQLLVVIAYLLGKKEMGVCFFSQAPNAEQV